MTKKKSKYDLGVIHGFLYGVGACVALKLVSELIDWLVA